MMKLMRGIMRHTIVFILLVAVSVGSSLLFARPAKTSALPAECRDSFLTIPAWYNYLPQDTSPDAEPCSPSLGDGNEEEQVNTSLAIGVAVLEGILRASTFVAVIMIFWGSFKFITSEGNPDNATKARQTVINAAVGFAIVLVASQIVAYIGRTLAS